MDVSGPQLDAPAVSTDNPMSPCSYSRAFQMFQWVLKDWMFNINTPFGFGSLSSQLRGPVAPFTPVFLDGWKPEPLRVDGQVWEDPVESQHKHEALQVKQEVQNTCG